jgi:hypothetical protein
MARLELVGERESQLRLFARAPITDSRYLTKESVLLVDLRLSEEEARGLNWGNAGILFVR